MNVGFVGAGHIAAALAKGWAARDVAGAPALFFHDVAPGRAAELAAQTGGTACDSLDDVVAAGDVVILAVRPADVRAALAEIGRTLGGRGVLSVAAGVTLAALRAALPAEARVGRIMPNIAAELGLGVFLFLPGTLGELAAPVRLALDRIGVTVEIDEELFDVGTSLAGCMPGFLGYIVEEFAAAGRAGGLDEATARTLAVGGVQGAAATIAKVGDPAAVVTATATPGGMTAAGLDRLREGGVGGGIAAAVAAATARAKELA